MTNVPRTDPAQSLSEPPAIEVAQRTVALRMSGFRIALEAGMSDSRENPLNIPRTIDGTCPLLGSASHRQVPSCAQKLLRERPEVAICRSSINRQESHHVDRDETDIDSIAGNRCVSCSLLPLVSVLALTG